MIIVGGRGSKIVANMPAEIYDTENSEYIVSEQYNKFRICIWNYESLLYAFAGFEHSNPSTPTNTLVCLNLNKVVNNRLEKREEKKEILEPKFEKPE